MAPFDHGVEILEPKSSTGSFSLGCTISGLSAVMCNYEKLKCSRRLSCRGNNLVDYVQNYANVVMKATTFRTLHNQ